MRPPTLISLLERVSDIRAGSRVWTLSTSENVDDVKELSLNWWNIFESENESGSVALTLQAKRFFAWFLSTHSDQSGERSAATLRNDFTHLRVLLVWMVKNGIFSFRDIPFAQISDYLLFRNSLQFGDAPQAKRTLNGKVRLLELLYESNLNIGVGVKFRIDTSIDHRVIGKLSQDKRWQPLPEEVAVPLLKDCVDWIRGPAGAFLNVIAMCQNDKDSAVGKSRERRKREDHRLIKSVCDPAEMSRLAQLLKLPGNTTWGKLLRLGRKETVAACSFILLFFTGIRVSELLSLKRGCVTQLRHTDGQSFPYLVGMVRKGGVRRHQWVAYDLIAEAVTLLERINEPIFVSNGDDRLLAAPPATAVLMHPGMRFTRKRVRDVNDLLKAFAAAPNRTHPIRTRIHSHQGRETFAQFVGYRDKNGLEALAAHYAHAHKRVTDSSYLGNDVDLSRMMAEKDRQDLGRALEDILSTTNIAGGVGDYLSKRFKTEAFRGKETLQATVDRLIRQGVRLAPCNWGYCLYRAELSACRGDAKGPNDINRTVSVCSSCANFSVTAKHGGWWEDRKQRNQTFLENKGIPLMAQQLARNRVQECDEILNKISIKVEFE